MDDTVSGLWKRLEKMEEERDALRDEINKLGNGLGDEILKVMELQRKLNIAVGVLEDSEKRLLELRDEELVKDLSVFKSCAMRIYSDIKDALKKLEEK